jgi:serine/threonine-protein phosphatase 2A regulatory subunit A
VPLILAMATDPVPNVRLNVAKTCEKVTPLLTGPQDTKSKIKTTLDALSKDGDADVKYYAMRALSA